MDWKEYVFFLCMAIMAVLIFRIIDGIIDRKSWQDKAIDTLKEKAVLYEKQQTFYLKYMEKNVDYAQFLVDTTETYRSSLEDMARCFDEGNIADLKDNIDWEIQKMSEIKEITNAMLQHAIAAQKRAERIDLDKLADEFFRRR